MNAPLNSGALATVHDAPTHALDIPAVSNQSLILDPVHLKNMMAVAEMMAVGMSTVPRHLQKNKGDCLAVVMQAAQWRMNPFAVAQKTHVVSGTLGYEAQLVNAVVNTMAPTKDRINYEWFGDWSKVMGKFEERESKKKVDEDTGKPLKYRVPAWNIKDEEGLGIKVWATMKGEDVPRELVLLLVQARTRNSPLWADDPRQQLAYLAVKRWTRLHCPDVLLGVYTPDELDQRPPKDMGLADEVGAVPNELMERAEAEASKGVAAYTIWWKKASNTERALLSEQTEEHERLKKVATAADEKRTVDNGTAGKAAPAPAPAPTPTDNTTPPAGDDNGPPTYARIEEMIRTAQNTVAVEIAEDWIADTPAQFHQELRDKAAARKAELATTKG